MYSNDSVQSPLSPPKWPHHSCSLFQSDLTTIESIGTHLPAPPSPNTKQEEEEVTGPQLGQHLGQHLGEHLGTPATQLGQHLGTPSTPGTQSGQKKEIQQLGPDYSGVKKVLEYGSDSSSDTGVCSLSSTEGDYSLSTLV